MPINKPGKDMLIADTLSCSFENDKFETKGMSIIICHFITLTSNKLEQIRVPDQCIPRATGYSCCKIYKGRQKHNTRYNQQYESTGLSEMISH